MDLHLSGKTVLITGATGRIGGATAAVYARAGANLVLTYRDNADRAARLVAEAEALGAKAIAVPYDLADPDSAAATVTSATEHFGGVDVYVANAALMVHPTPGRPFEDIPAAEWTESLRATVEGTFRTAQAVVPGMKKRDWGRIVFVSGEGVRVGMAGREEFAAGKAALEGLSRSLAAGVGRAGVLSNVVSPGGTMPPELAATMAADPVAGPRVARMLGQTATGRFSLPEEVADAIAFLGSGANGNITGAVLPVSGGM